MKTFTISAFFSLLVLYLGCSTVAAQSAAPALANIGSLTGTVLDSTSHQPVAYATVVLLSAPPASQVISGVATDDQGRFALEKLVPGAYRLQVSFVGYATYVLPVAVTTGARALGSIQLSAATRLLGDAVVVGIKPLVEVRTDRLIYNADQDVTNAGGTAADVLRKAPLLAVDGEGNVKMRGSGNFKVLVNNKPSPTLASNLAEALKGIPAEQIQSVEVITTPSAKYDGEGTAGIINIVLKKGVNQHLSGRVGVSSGNRNSNFNSALNSKQGKIGFTSSASAGTWNSPGEFTRNRFGYTAQGPDTLNQTGNTLSKGEWLYGTLGVDYDPAEHHTFSLAGSVQGYRGNSQLNLLNQYRSGNATGNQLFLRNIHSIYGGLNVEGTGTYTRTFVQPRKEWSVLAQYARNNGTFGYDFDQYNNSLVPLGEGQAHYREHSRGRTPGEEITLQSDFTQPFGEQTTLEAGMKAIFRRTGSVASVDGSTLGQGPSFEPLPNRGTNFTYTQDVQAAYAIYSRGFGKKVNASLGSRLERTAIKATFGEAQVPFAPYTQLLPSGNVRYAFNDTTSLRFAYSRRITRPFIDYINPFVDASDPKNVSFGNPKLRPELTDSYELNYNTTIKTVSLNASLSARHTGNAIEQVRFVTTNSTVPLPAEVPVDASVTAQTFANVAANTFYQFNMYLSAKPLAKLEVSVGPDVQYIVRSSSMLSLKRQGFTAGLNANAAYNFDKGFALQSFVYASLGAPQIQGTSPANLYYQISAKKNLLKDRVEASINLTSPFNAYWAYRSTTTTQFFEERNEYRAFQRSFRLNFSYRFGQSDQGRQRKQINNDDTKGGNNKMGGN